MDIQKAHTRIPNGKESRVRRVTFRVISIVVGLWFLAVELFGLTEVVLMWLPADTLASITGEPASGFVAHRSHFMSIGIVAWAIVLCTLAQWRKPEKRVGSMLLLLVFAVAGAVVFAFSGGLAESLVEEGAFFLLPILLLAFFHPRARDLLRKPSFNRAMAVAAGVAAVPWAVYLASNSAQQLANVAGDSHAEMEHWSLAALMAIVLVAAGFIGSSSHDGWHLPAWIAVGGSFLFGVHSLVFPGLASGLHVFWAVAAMTWAVVFAALTVRRVRMDTDHA